MFITCPFEVVNKLDGIKDDYPNAVIFPVENIGMDVLPFLNVAKKFELHKYDAVLKLHTKNDKSETGDILGRLSLDGVLGTQALVDKVLHELLPNKDIGMVGSECLYRSALKVMYDNRPNVEKLLKAMSLDWPEEEWGFFAGTMFWIRGVLLKKLVYNYEEIIKNVYAETKKSFTGGDGEWAHAMERVFGLLPNLNNQKVATSYPETEISGHNHLRKVPPVKHGSKKAFHGFSADDLFRYKNLPIWAEQCRNSALFDELYYREKAGENIPDKIDAATHFVLFGDIFGFSPSRQFSVTEYLKKNPDVARTKSSVPSLVHFLSCDKEGDAK